MDIDIDIDVYIYPELSKLRGNFRVSSTRKSLTLFVGTPRYPYGVAYRKTCGFSTPGLLENRLFIPVCGAVCSEVQGLGI